MVIFSAARDAGVERTRVRQPKFRQRRARQAQFRLMSLMRTEGGAGPYKIAAACALAQAMLSISSNSFQSLLTLTEAHQRKRTTHMKALVYNGPHDVSIKEMPDAYKHFDAREDGWTKVVLKPAA